MSDENVEIVRRPVPVGQRPRRRLQERLALRFTRLLTLGGRLVMRLSPRSKLRQLAIRRIVRLAIEATNRADFEAAFVFWAPDAETINARELLTVGGAPSETHSRDARIRFQQQWSAEWDGFGFDRAEYIDLGDRLLVLVHGGASGPTSGVRIDQDAGFLLDLSDGRVVREQAFFSHDEVLKAAGVSE